MGTQKKQSRCGGITLATSQRLIFGFLFFASLIIASLSKNLGWKFFGVPRLEPNFVDLHTITEGNRCAQELNLNPMVSNPCDPYERVMNYPRIWLVIADVVGNNVEALASLIFFAAFVGYGLFSYRKENVIYRGLIFTLTIMSPVMLLAIERGTNDVAIFGLTAIGIKLVATSSTIKNSMGLLALFVASILKIFPVLCFLVAASLLFKKGKLSYLSALLIMLLTAYMLLSLGDLQAIVAGTPSPAFYSFGVGQFLSLLRTLGGTALGSSVIYFALFFVAAMLLVNNGRCKSEDAYKTKFLFVDRPRIPHEPQRQQLLLATVLFGSTLLISSWAYRYIFAFLLIPLLLDLRSQDGGSKSLSLLLITILTIPLLLAFQSDGQLSISNQVIALTVTPLCLVITTFSLYLSMTKPRVKR